jgi:ribosomal protein L15
MSWKGQVPRYRRLPKKSKLRYQKELEKFTSEWKPVSENSERKTMSESEVIERETFTHW